LVIVDLMILIGNDSIKNQQSSNQQSTINNHQ